MIRMIFKIVTTVILIVVAVCLVTAAFIPTLVSSAWGRQQLMALVNAAIPGKVEVDSMNLGWASPQRVTGLRLRDAKGEQVLSVSRIEMSHGLWHLVVGNKNFGKISVTEPVATLYRQSGKRNSVELALGGSSRVGGELGASVPPSMFHFDLGWQGELELLGGSVKVVGAGPSASVLSDIEVNLALGWRGSPAMLRAVGKSQHDNRSGKFQIDGLIRGLDSEKTLTIQRTAEGGFSLPAGVEVLASAELTHWPVEVLDALFACGRGEDPGIFVSAIGDELDGTFSHEWTADALKAEFNVQAARLSGALSLQSRNGMLSLVEPGKLSLTVTPSLVDQLQGQGPKDPGLHIGGDAPVLIELKRFEFPIHGKASDASFFSQATIGTVNILPGDLSEAIQLRGLSGAVSTSKASDSIILDLSGDGTYRGKAIGISGQGQFEEALDTLGRFTPGRMKSTGALSLRSLPVAFLDAVAGPDSILGELLGQWVDIELKGEAHGMRGTVHSTIKSDNLELQQLSLKVDEWIRLVEPSTAKGRLTPKLLMSLMGEGSITFPQAMPYNLELRRLDIPLRGQSLRKAGIEGKLDVAATPISGVPKFGNAELEDLTVNFGGNGLDKAPISVKGRVIPKGGTEPFARLWQSPAELSASGTVRLAPDGDISIQGLRAELRSTHLYIRGQGKLLAGQVLTLTKPLVAQYTVTPEAFSKLEWHGTTKPQLFEPAILDVKVLPTSLAVDDNFLASMKMEGSAVIDKLTIGTVGKEEKETFSKIQLSWQASGITNKATATLNGSRDGGGKPLQANLSVKNWLHGDELDLEKAHLVFKAAMEKAPVLIPALLSGASASTLETVEAAFGNSLDLNIDVDVRQLNGKLSARFAGEHCKGSMAGTLNDGVLTLTKDIEAQLDVTPQISKHILADVNPLLVRAVSAEHPVKLRVDQTDFRLPIKGFSIRDLVIANASFDAGRVVLSNGGVVATALAILRAGSLQDVPEIQAWFTPQYIKVKDGIVTIDRLDMLLGVNFHLAMWGTVDIVHDVVRMSLGLSPQALRHAFGIKSLESDEMLVLHVKGQPGKLKVDTTKATAQITGLIAKEKSGKAGKAIGDLLDVAGINVGSEKVPPPTTTPLPWEKDKEIMAELLKEGDSADAPPAVEEATIEEAIKDPKKYIEKELKGLFKKKR